MIKQRFVKQASEDKEKNVYLGNKRYVNIIVYYFKTFSTV